MKNPKKYTKIIFWVILLVCLVCLAHLTTDEQERRRELLHSEKVFTDNDPYPKVITEGDASLVLVHLAGMPDDEENAAAICSMLDKFVRWKKVRISSWRIQKREGFNSVDGVWIDHKAVSREHKEK